MSSEPAGGQPAERVAEIVLAVPGVAGLSSGAFGDLATYLPGQRLAGVRQRQGRIEIGIVLQWGASAAPVVRTVRQAVLDEIGGPVDITISDVAAPEPEVLGDE